MRRRRKRLWMAVTADRFELPIAVGDTAAELAGMLGRTRAQIYRKRARDARARKGWRAGKRPRREYWIICVWW